MELHIAEPHSELNIAEHRSMEPHIDVALQLQMPVHHTDFCTRHTHAKIDIHLLGCTNPL